MSNAAKPNEERSVAALMRREMSPAESYLIVTDDTGARDRQGRTSR